MFQVHHVAPPSLCQICAPVTFVKKVTQKYCCSFDSVFCRPLLVAAYSEVESNKNFAKFQQLIEQKYSVQTMGIPREA